MRPRVLCLALFRRAVDFPSALRGIPVGVAVGPVSRLPEGWIRASTGRLGLPHAYLLRQEREEDLRTLPGLIYLPGPSSRHILPEGIRDVLLLAQDAKGDQFLEGRKAGRDFRVPAYDLNLYRRVPVHSFRLSTRPRPPWGAFLLDWDGGEWDEAFLNSYQWLSWEHFSPPPPASVAVDETLPLSPDLKAGAVEVGLRRAQEPTPLGLTPPPVRTTPFHQTTDDPLSTLEGVVPRDLTSSMQGESRILHGGREVVFRQGRLNHCLWGSGADQRCGPVRSWIEVEGRRYGFVSVSSFAIESDREWGLRESLVVNSPHFSHPGRLVVDYLAFEGQPELVISLSVQWPQFARETTVTAWAPWEIRLGKLPLLTQATMQLYHEGRWGTVDRSNRVFTCQALRVSWKGSGLTFRFLQGLCHRPHWLPWRQQHREIWLNPEGSYTPVPSSRLSGWVEHHLWAIRWETQPFEQWPPEPPGALISPMVLSRASPSRNEIFSHFGLTIT